MRIATQIDVRSKSDDHGFALPRKKFLMHNEAPTPGPNLVSFGRSAAPSWYLGAQRTLTLQKKIPA